MGMNSLHLDNRTEGWQAACTGKHRTLVNEQSDRLRALIIFRHLVCMSEASLYPPFRQTLGGVMGELAAEKQQSGRKRRRVGQQDIRSFWKTPKNNLTLPAPAQVGCKAQVKGTYGHGSDEGGDGDSGGGDPNNNSGGGDQGDGTRVSITENQDQNTTAGKPADSRGGMNHAMRLPSDEAAYEEDMGCWICSTTSNALWRCTVGLCRVRYCCACVECGCEPGTACTAVPADFLCELCRPKLGRKPIISFAAELSPAQSSRRLLTPLQASQISIIFSCFVQSTRLPGSTGVHFISP